MKTEIRAARVEEADSLSDLAFRSKSQWPYTAAQFEVFRRELTITKDELAAAKAYVAEASGSVAGFYTLVASSGDEVELGHLFVDPEKLTQGIGARLFRHACDQARSGGARTLAIQSDPNAAGFYESLGAIR